jgi:hypothetical protein
MNKQQRGRDYSMLLIFSAALVTVVRYAAAFIASDSVQIEAGLSTIITYAMGFSGLGMGVLDVFGGAYLFDGWRRTMPRNDQAWPFKFKVLTGFVVGLIVNGILILIPFTMSRVSGVTMHGILGDDIWLFGWSVVVNIAPYLLIGGVTVGNQIVTVKQEETFGNFPGNFPQGNKPSTERSEKVPQWRTFKKNLLDAELLDITNMAPTVIAKSYRLTVKAAKDWPEYARRELVARGLLKDA